jgi:tyrosine-protein kinase Etk/Wzc
MSNDESRDQLAGRAPYGSEWPGSFGPPGGGRPGGQGEDGIDISQLWAMVRDNARVVFAIGAAVFIVVMAHCLTSPMTFKSVARMYLGESEAKAPSAGSTNLDISAGSSEAGSEIEVLRSRSMVRRAILASGLNVTIAPPGWKSPRFWRWLLSRRNPDLLDGAAAEVGATETMLPEEIVGGRKFRVSFINRIDYALSGPGIKAVAGRLGQPLKVAGFSMTLVAGRKGPKPGAEFEVFVEPLEEVVERVLGQLSVTVPKSAAGSEPVRVLILEFTSQSRRVSASFLEQLMRGYLEARHAWKTEDASAAESFVTEQLASMQQSLDRTQHKLAEYRAENRAVVLGSEAEAMVQQVNRYEEQRVAAMLQVSALRDIKRAVNDPKAPLEAYMFGEANDSVLQHLAASLTEARQRLSELDVRYHGVAPEMQQQNAQVKTQLEGIRNYVDGRLSRAEKNVAALTHVIEESEAKLKTVPSAELGLSQIGRESEVYGKMYSYLLERQQQAAITKASTVSKNRILDLPQIPLREDSPKLGLHLASGVLGLLLGAALVILRGLFSGIFRRENDVRNVLGPVQLFARIPVSMPKLRAKHNDAWPARPLFDVMAAQTDFGYAEGFRSLRTNLYRALPGEHGKVLLVTSPCPGDGKTTCALSLAAMLAADNRRVLVIDADVRKPSHHTLLGVAQEPGLRDVLQMRNTWKDATRAATLSVGWFDSISAGVGASAELLSDGYFATFLVNARSHYDYVVLDSPSYPLVSDPLALAPMSDFVLSVLRLGNTPRKLAEEHLRGMFTVARGYAVVVNNADPPRVYGTSSKPARSLPSALRRTP